MKLKRAHYSSIEGDARLLFDFLITFWTTILALAAYLSQPPIPYFLSGIWMISFICLGVAWGDIYFWLKYLWEEGENIEGEYYEWE